MKRSLVGLILIVILATVMYLVSGIKPTYKIPCTQEALICPDGSTVGRSGPKCEFAACPKVVKTKPTITVAPNNYQCPEDEWVNCMPPISIDKNDCKPQFLQWAKTNCPKFKGAAY